MVDHDNCTLYYCCYYDVHTPCKNCNELVAWFTQIDLLQPNCGHINKSRLTLVVTKKIKIKLRPVYELNLRPV